MAIASIVLHAGCRPQELAVVLRATPGVMDAREIPPDKLAAVLECPADRLPAFLRGLRKRKGVINLELAFVNYEDDLEACGQINCPPLAELKKK